MNDRELIHDSFDKIKLKEEKKKHVYYEIQRNYDKQGFVSNQKLRFFKKRFDRYVPAVAVFIILIGVFSYLGVSYGWLTGYPYVPEETVADTAEAGAAAAGRGAESAEQSTAAQPAAFSAGTGGATTANVYAGLDVGYTLYVIEGIPQDALVLWQEMEELSVVPAEISLEAYEISDSTLTLDFNESLQEIQNASATTAMVTGIAQTYRDFYPEVSSLVMNSAGNPVTFEGEAIDINAEAAIDITDREVIQYVSP